VTARTLKRIMRPVITIRAPAIQTCPARDVTSDVVVEPAVVPGDEREHGQCHVAEPRDEDQRDDPFTTNPASGCTTRLRNR
jgi:hypothetical protein